MQKVNFKTIIIPGIDGQPIEADFSRQLGNQLYMQGRDIEECELGKKIYFAEGEIEISEKEADIVRKAVQPYAYVARTAICQAMEATEGKE